MKNESGYRTCPDIRSLGWRCTVPAHQGCSTVEVPDPAVEGLKLIKCLAHGEILLFVFFHII